MAERIIEKACGTCGQSVQHKCLVERSKWIRIDPFEYGLLVVLTNDIEGSIQKHRKKFPEFASISSENAAAIHIYHPEESFSMIILEFEPMIHHVIHEAFHLVWRVFEWSGAHHENEIMAYMLGFVTNQILLFAQKTGSPKPPKIPRKILKQLEDPAIRKKLEKGQRVTLRDSAKSEP